VAKSRTNVRFLAGHTSHGRGPGMAPKGRTEPSAAAIRSVRFRRVCVVRLADLNRTMRAPARVAMPAKCAPTKPCRRKTACQRQEACVAGGRDASFHAVAAAGTSKAGIALTFLRQMPAVFDDLQMIRTRSPICGRCCSALISCRRAEHRGIAARAGCSRSPSGRTRYVRATSRRHAEALRP